LLAKNIKNQNKKKTIIWGRGETWFLTLRNEYRLKEFKNRVLREIFGHKRAEETADWRKLYDGRDGRRMLHGGVEKFI
jgi:hypothetical protein